VVPFVDASRAIAWDKATNAPPVAKVSTATAPYGGAIPMHTNRKTTPIKTPKPEILIDVMVDPLPSRLRLLHHHDTGLDLPEE
jgi:hypothetical protein